ncbi:MAG: PorT family protein [Pedobacter sp.]|nr:MAG: PorT family protein [Pedobacter sp.]
MKKTLIAIACVLFAATTNAQEKNGFRLGLTAHPNFGFIKAEGGKGNGTNLGFTYGLLGDFNFAENYSFATGLTITTINGKSTEINPVQYTAPGTYDLKYKMQYLQIPLSIKLKTDEKDDMKFYGQFGLTTDFRLGARYDVEQGNTPLADGVKATDHTKFFRAGMLIGGGVEYRLSGKTSLLGGITYNNGLTNIAKKPHSVKNHYVGINIGVFF